MFNMLPIVLLVIGTLATVEGIATEWYQPRSGKAKILIIGGVFVALVAMGMIRKAILSGLYY